MNLMLLGRGEQAEAALRDMAAAPTVTCPTAITGRPCGPPT